MSIQNLIILILSSLLAAAGQVLFKIGAGGATKFEEFVNFWIVGGAVFYILGAVLWIYALSVVELTRVFPFTGLTFVLVYGVGILFFEETLTPLGLVGGVLVVVGLFFLTR